MMHKIIEIQRGSSLDGCLQPAATPWQSRQVVVTPEVLGMRSAGECQQRAEQLGLTPLPRLPYRQEHWRLDVLLVWSRANGFDYLPILGQGSAQRR
jgi:hypothetical protein